MYQELKDLVMKTYTTADAPVQARDALFAITMALQIGLFLWPLSARMHTYSVLNFLRVTCPFARWGTKIAP